MQKIKILFVCLGNICLSAAAEAVMKAKVAELGVAELFEIDSAGISSAHQGEPADERMRRHASRRGFDVTSISRPIKLLDFEYFDYVIGMDDSNIDVLMDRALTLEHKQKIRKMTDYCVGYDDTYVPDPYYGGASGFELVLDLLEDACLGLLTELNKNFENDEQ